jgi:type I restriction-modification system DNA methylase subunit
MKNKKNDISNNLGHFIFYQIPRDLKDNIYKELVKKIEKIPVGYNKERKVNLSGKVYEYFIGRDQTAISELGAYFTDRHITDFIYNKIKPSLDDNNNIKTMIDPFGGSGGFTLNYASYLRDNFNDINWSENVNNIYHFDMEESVVKMTGLEMFAITNYFPKKERNYERVNSFTYEFPDKYNDYQKFYYVISNPPYGGDKNNKSGEQIKRDKIINYIKSLENKDQYKNQIENYNEENKKYKEEQEKQQVNVKYSSQRIKKFANKYKLDGKDKESCSLMLLADLLDINGTACLVLKEGVFFDSKYSSLRQVILENYNVTNIISVPQNAFENTSTKTSIIIFHNNGKTKNIIFSELVVELESDDIFEIYNNEVHLTNNKGEIKQVREQEICYASLEQITKNKYSLNYKDYKSEYCHFVFKNNNIQYPKNYELIKLNDVMKFKPKSKRPASFGQSEGKFRFYTSSEKIKYCNECDINDKENLYLIFGTGGNGSLFIDNIFSCSADNIISSIDNKLNCLYTYFYIKIFWTEFIKFHFNGSTMGHIKKENLVLTQIPIPKDINIIKSELEYLYELHNNITNNEIKEKENNICELIKTLTSDSNNYDEYKLGDVCEFKKKSKRNASFGQLEGKYNFYTSSDKIQKCDIADYNEELIIIGSGGVVNIKIDNIFSCSADNFILKTNHNEYIYYLIKGNMNYLINGFTGSCLKHISKEYLLNLQIPILKPNIMKEHKLEELFNEVDVLKEKLESNKKEYDIKLKELFKDFNISEENIINNNNEEDIEPKIKPISVQEIKQEKDDLLKLSLSQLKEKCKSLGITGYSKLNKTELIEKINNK